MRRPLATVIIPTFNRAGLLARTLASLERQTVPRHQFEVLVIDDGSTDETYAVATRYRNLNLWYWRQNDLGFRAAAARNVGICRSRAPICVLLDAGMLAASDFLACHLHTHAATPGSAAVIGSIAGLDQHGHKHHSRSNGAIESLIDDQDISGSIDRLHRGGYRDIREDLFYAKYGDRLAYWPAPWTVFWTGNVSVPTTLLRDVGLFDEHFTTWGGEDTELGIRLSHFGTRMVLQRSARSIHIPHEKVLASLSDAHRASVRRATLERIHRKHNTLETKLLIDIPLEDLNDVLAVPDEDRRHRKISAARGLSRG